MLAAVAPTLSVALALLLVRAAFVANGCTDAFILCHGGGVLLVQFRYIKPPEEQ